MAEQSKQRQRNGRFATGNSGSPGRPRRRVELEYLMVLGETVSLATWRKIARRAVQDALNGDAGARSWLAKYLIGSTGNSLETAAAAEQAGLTIEDGLAELSAEMEAKQHVQTDES